MAQISEIESMPAPLAELNGSAPIDGDFDTLSERFHRLVDKKFLGTLTPDEEEELKTLTKWHDRLGEELYQSLFSEQYVPRHVSSD